MPLSALLSYALVAFTIEFDNEAEHRMPHRTTNFGSTPGALHAPWLVSMVMWTNCMQHVPEQGITVRELYRKARIDKRSLRVMLTGMRRWGYIRIMPAPAGKTPKPSHSDFVVRSAAGGKTAQEVWRPLATEIEERWRERFGENEIERLRKTLSSLISQFDRELPDGLPILGFGLLTTRPEQFPQSQQFKDTTSLPLPALLSKVLLMFALEFERESKVSLAISANLLRVLSSMGTRIRDLPRFSGVSKEAIAVALNFLTKRGYVTVKPESPGSKTKAALLTAKGRAAREKYFELVTQIEDRWRARYGKSAVLAVRESLEQLVADSSQASALFRGLEPRSECWRASVPKSETLPHFPMVSHRGGFPDGS